MNPDARIVPHLRGLDASTADVVMKVVSDAALAAMLRALSDEVPKVGRQVATATATATQLTRSLLSLQVIIAAVGLRKTYADPDPDPDPVGITPTRADNFQAQCGLVSAHTRFLAMLLPKGYAYKEQLQRTFDACVVFLPWISELASALIESEVSK